MSGKEKKATRGQKQIHEENRQTILYYSLASLISALLVVVMAVAVGSSNGRWVGWTASSLFQALALGIMYKMMKSIRNDRQQVIDAGADLNDPQAFGEYCKDTVILCSLAHVMSVISPYFYWLLSLVPVYAFYKLWINFLSPWIFAQPMVEEDGAEDGKKHRRREKRVVLRR